VVWRDVNRLHPTHHQFITVVAPVYWHYTDRYSDAGTPAGPAPGTRTRRTLLPLTTWGKDQDGTAHLWVPSHGWDDQTKGFKRNYRAFFEIFQYHGRPAGGSEMRILWRLYHQRTGPGGNYVSAGPLFTYDNEGALSDGDRYFECLFGLIKRSWGHESGWRLFYVPFGSH
jgi:hypothetical protein